MVVIGQGGDEKERKRSKRQPNICDLLLLLIGGVMV